MTSLEGALDSSFALYGASRRFFALNFDQNGWLWTFQLVLYSLCFVSKIQLRHKIELIATCYNRCKIGNYCNHYKIAWQ